MAQARDSMVAILGEGKLSDIKSWLRSGVAMEDAVMEKLRALHWLLDYHILDNVYFVGGGTGAVFVWGRQILVTSSNPA